VEDDNDEIAAVSRRDAPCVVCGRPFDPAQLRFAREYRLSRRELEVARCAAQGAMNREIAEHLHLSRRTVEGHLQHVFEKLQIRSRTRLAVLFHTLDPD
jgi:DNA-binding NarL/FixJ family response regulator